MKHFFLFLLIPILLIACSSQSEPPRLKNVKPLNIQFFETYNKYEIQDSWNAASKWFHENDTFSKQNKALLKDVIGLENWVSFRGEGAFGYVEEEDIQSVNSVLDHPEVKAMFPKDLQFMWSFGVEETLNYKKIYALYAVKVPKDGLARIDGRHIKDAFASISDYDKRPIINLTMTQEGSHDWKLMTRDNIGRYIALTLDKKVFSCPKVIAEISGGQTQISGNFTKQQAEELAAQIKAGRKY
ncbi:preprotein translocase subunit SecD [compost metagenome]